MTPVETIKSKLDVVGLWRLLYPRSAPKSGRNWIYHSPFRADKKPSFSIFAGGQRFKDHATSEGGDVITFAALAYNCSQADAIKRLGAEVGALPERKNIVPASGKKPLDRVEYEKLKKKCLTDFKLEPGTVIYNFLKAKQISFDVARALNREGSLGCYYGMPCYVYSVGIKVRHSAESSRSTRWMIGSDGGLPWRFNMLSEKVRNVIITEGESDLLIACTAIAGSGNGTRVIAASRAGWRPDDALMERIGRDRCVIVAIDHDRAGMILEEWLIKRISYGSVFPWNDFPTLKDLCDIGPVKLAPTLQKLIAP